MKDRKNGKNAGWLRDGWLKTPAKIPVKPLEVSDEDIARAAKALEATAITRPMEPQDYVALQKSLRTKHGYCAALSPDLASICMLKADHESNHEPRTIADALSALPRNESIHVVGKDGKPS